MARWVTLIAVGALSLSIAEGDLIAQDFWYESYRAGVEALRRDDVKTAETKLVDALAKRPRQGRNISVPGARIDYLPEVYLGLVRLKQQRFTEAAALLQKSLDTQLVRKQDREYAEVQQGLDASRRGDIETFKARTVKIEAVKADGKADTGTGIIVSVKADGVYILTALHVAMDNDGSNAPPRSMKVGFYRGEQQAPIASVEATWLDKFVTELDLAAIRVTPAADVATRMSPWELRPTLLEARDPIFTVGHAIRDNTVIETNVVLNPAEPDSRYFLFTAAGIGERASGGPVIDKRGYLAGLMISLDPRAGKGTAVHVKELGFWINRWDIGATEASGLR